MANQKRRTKAIINGKEYTIVGDKSAAHVELVAEIINEQLEELNSLLTSLSKEEQAILMAVNAVSDQVKMQQELIALEEKIKQSGIHLDE